MVTKVALPLTFVFAYDGEAKSWAAIACEIDIGSCGDSLDEARFMVQDAVSLWATHEIESGRGDRLAHPIPQEALAELIQSAPPDKVVVEHHTLLLLVDADAGGKVTSAEFVRSSVPPVCYPPRVAA